MSKLNLFRNMSAAHSDKATCIVQLASQACFPRNCWQTKSWLLKVMFLIMEWNVEISFCKQQDQEDEGTAVLSASNWILGNPCFLSEHQDYFSSELWQWDAINSYGVNSVWVPFFEEYSGQNKCCKRVYILLSVQYRKILRI